ncbi:RHS repeat domain-containing protein [Providencia stuartii]|uniref:RHS repeat domain-containing protein n=1 Tax=Providencia stuartii TaxID=588 RepID=UPI0038572568
MYHAYNDYSYTSLARIECTDTPANPRCAIYYTHSGLNGLPEALTNGDGHLVWQGQYGVWGNLQRQARPTGEFNSEQNLRFQGQYFDKETGLHYNTFRYYAPDLGRFTQQDPIGLAGGLNLYQYAPNPLTWVYPLGLKCWSTARKDFWKNEAKINPHKYSPKNLARMNDGLAPKMKIEVFNHKKQKVEIKDVSMEIHHRNLPQRSGTPKANERWNIEKTTPWGHESMDPYRHTGYDLLRIIKGINSW